MKRVLSLSLAVVMLFTLLPVSALAKDAAAVPATETEAAEAAQATEPEEPAEEPVEAGQDVEEAPATQGQPKQAASRGSLAAANSIVDSGTCGNYNSDLTWILDSAGTLIISGTGDMSGYDLLSPPWSGKKSDIKSVVISDGVTSIGYRAFSGCNNMTSVSIPNSVTSIGGNAFYGCSSLTSISIPRSVGSIGLYAFS